MADVKLGLECYPDVLQQMVADLRRDEHRQVTLTLRVLFSLAEEVAEESARAGYQRGYERALLEAAWSGRVAPHDHEPRVTKVYRDEFGCIDTIVKQ